MIPLLELFGLFLLPVGVLAGSLWGLWLLLKRIRRAK